MMCSVIQQDINFAEKYHWTSLDEIYKLILAVLVVSK